MKQFNLDSFVPVMRNLMTTRQDSGCHWRWSTAVGGSPPSTYRGYPIDPKQLKYDNNFNDDNAMMTGFLEFKLANKLDFPPNSRLRTRNVLNFHCV